jgi:rRNA maturation endonuclease Nob1
MMDEFANNMESIASDRVQKEFENRFGIKCQNCKIVNLTHAKYCNACGSELSSN